MVIESPAPATAGQPGPESSDIAPDSKVAFTQDEMSVLVWLVSKGMANALSGLSHMLGRTIQVTSLDLRRLETRKAADILEPPGTPGVGIHLKINGDAAGHMMLVYEPAVAFQLVDLQLHQPAGSTKRLEEMASSVLGEMGNVAGTFFLNALADTSNLVLMPSPPEVMIDAARSILNVPLDALAETQEGTYVMKASFDGDAGELGGRLVILPTTEFVRAVVKRPPM